MAEFSEVAMQVNRLCKNVVKCDECGLCSSNNGRDLGCTNLMREYPKEFEEIVMKWAEEHPVMTNKQKLLDVVAEAFGEKISKEFSRALVVSCANLGGECGGKCSNCEFQDFWDKEYQPPVKDAADE